MRGRTDEQPALFHTFHVEDRIRADHPLRDVKRRVDRILASLSADFAKVYSRIGRPSVPPERLLKAQLLLSLYSIRSERQLCERIDTDLLFRWFLDLQPSEEAFDHAVFSHERKRLDAGDPTRAFFDAVVADKGYDSDAFVAELRKQGIEVVIPPRSNRLHPREYDRYIYKVRNEVERFINKLKQLRRVATHYEKTACSFMGILHLGATMLLLA